MSAAIFLHIFLICCCIISVELVIFFKFKNILQSLKKVALRVVKVLNSDSISDCWKEKIIPYYSFLIFKISTKSLFFLLSIIGIFLLPNLIFKDFIYFCLSALGVIESIIICTLYIKIRGFVIE